MYTYNGVVGIFQPGNRYIHTIYHTNTHIHYKRAVAHVYEIV